MTILVGAGGNSVDALSFSYLASLGDISFVDDNKCGSFCDYPIIGTIDDLIEKYSTLDNPFVYNCVGSAGNNSARNKVFEKLSQAGIKTTMLNISNDISDDVIINSNVLIGAKSIISHGCEIGESTVISPTVTICGNVKVGKNVFIGAGAIIIQGITIGENAVIGAGAVVIKDVASNTVVVGNPAREIKSTY